ncbi:dihydrofolate reductase [Faecalibaculum rodentium]|uniref:dihydrofolate reductase n=1 Tax=Faecalibaculum rodentium TaxID=1702221 RepID=UPI0023F0CCFB|nr:dihydrofolate reductase [Faecalibaculum rodentium]
MKLELIAAVGRNLELGKDNDLIFDIPGDLKFFARTTRGHTIVMGRRTFDSLPHKLPGRHHVVISRTMTSDDPDIEIFDSLEAFLEAYGPKDELVYGIGGASLYAQMLSYAGALVLTEVDADADADVYFPAFDADAWKATELGRQEENGLAYRHVRYERP